jgi:hypothetical protein
MGLGCSLTVTRSVPSLLNEPCTLPSNVFHDDAASARWPATSALPRSLQISTTAGFVSGGRFGPAHISTATKPIGENAACSARAPLRDGAAGSLEQAQNNYQRGRRHLLIQATSAPGRFKPKEAAAVRSNGPWIPTEVGVGPCPAESLTGPMEKMSHRGEGPIWHHTAERRAESCCVRHPPSHPTLS